ncbi:MAG: hypothetical protein Kow0031_07870 [Anaerolineae bacterium]
MAVGWLLMLLLPFSLFEATLLTLVAMIIVTIYWYIILKPRMSDMPGEDRIMQIAIKGVNYHVQDHLLDYIAMIHNNEWRQRCTLFEDY